VESNLFIRTEESEREGQQDELRKNEGKKVWQEMARREKVIEGNGEKVE
jgi:hypothetical protein